MSSTDAKPSPAPTPAVADAARDAAQAERKEREHFFGAAKVVALLTLASRVLGLFREMTIAWLGATWQAGIYQTAFALPNLFRRLFGEGALTAAFVPVFSDTFEQDKDKARRLLANTLGLLAVLLITLGVLIQVGLLVWLWLSPADRDDRQYLVLLMSIMLPFMVFVCLLALASAALNCRGHFAYPAAAPIILNVCMIAADSVAAFFWNGDIQAHFTTIAASVPVAGAIQLAAVLWLLKRSGMPVRPRILPIEGGVKQILKLMAPTVLGIGFLQMSQLFDYLAGLFFSVNNHVSTLNVFGYETGIALPLSEGAITQMTTANRLFQFPMGVFAISLGVAVFPLLARYASRQDMPNLRGTLNRALRLSLMEGLATGAGLFILADPIMKLIFVRGKYTMADAQTAAYILRMYVLGMAAVCSYQILSRAFYSLKDPRTPLRVSCMMAGVYMALVSILIWVPGIGPGAFGLAPTITFTLNVAILLMLLRKRVGRIGGRQLLVSVLRSLVCCAAMMAAVGGMRLYLGWDMNSKGYFTHGWGLGLAVGIYVAVGAVVFVLTAWLLRAPELGELLGPFLEKLRGRKGAAACD